ncbi:hypothetical protein HDU92_006488 [Lobulomyces angularis]|nr:hypothetical protein HDU92_006488 [Lobulomyces angularis]
MDLISLKKVIDTSIELNNSKKNSRNQNKNENYPQTNLSEEKILKNRKNLQIFNKEKQLIKTHVKPVVKPVFNVSVNKSNVSQTRTGLSFKNNNSFRKDLFELNESDKKLRRLVDNTNLANKLLLEKENIKKKNRLKKHLSPKSSLSQKNFTNRENDSMSTKRNSRLENVKKTPVLKLRQSEEHALKKSSNYSDLKNEIRSATPYEKVKNNNTSDYSNAFNVNSNQAIADEFHIFEDELAQFKSKLEREKLNISEHHLRTLHKKQDDEELNRINKTKELLSEQGQEDYSDQPREDSIKINKDNTTDGAVNPKNVMFDMLTSSSDVDGESLSNTKENAHPMIAHKKPVVNASETTNTGNTKKFHTKDAIHLIADAVVSMVERKLPLKEQFPKKSNDVENKVLFEKIPIIPKEQNFEIQKNLFNQDEEEWLKNEFNKNLQKNDMKNNKKKKNSNHLNYFFEKEKKIEFMKPNLDSKKEKGDIHFYEEVEVNFGKDRFLNRKLYENSEAEEEIGKCKSENVEEFEEEDFFENTEENNQVQEDFISNDSEIENLITIFKPQNNQNNVAALDLSVPNNEVEEVLMINLSSSTLRNIRKQRLNRLDELKDLFNFDKENVNEIDLISCNKFIEEGCWKIFDGVIQEILEGCCDNVFNEYEVIINDFVQNIFQEEFV